MTGLPADNHMINVRSLTLSNVMPHTWASCYCREQTLHHHLFGLVPEFYLWVHAVEISNLKPNLHVSLFYEQACPSP